MFWSEKTSVREGGGAWSREKKRDRKGPPINCLRYTKEGHCASLRKKIVRSKKLQGWNTLYEGEKSGSRMKPKPDAKGFLEHCRSQKKGTSLEDT